ncbi:MAG: metallophosphoesterase [Candidatus Woesearchaeota archaeon]
MISTPTTPPLTRKDVGKTVIVMKALIFGDTHGDAFMLEILKRKAEQAETVFCLGDLTIFGEELNYMLTILDEFPAPVYLIHGNHETEDEMKQAVKKHTNITYVHKQQVKAGEFTIIGYGGDGFSKHDEEFETSFEKSSKELKEPHKTVVLLHGPPAETRLDIPFDNHHSGSESYREFIEAYEPLIVFSGHIHECEGEYDLIGETILHNPGPEGTLIDLGELSRNRTASKKNQNTQ